MSVIVRQTEKANMALIPSGTFSEVKAELERQNIKFVAKYVGTQIMKKLGVDRYMKLTQESSDFISEYGLCLIEAYGEKEDLQKLGVSLYVPREKLEAKKLTPLDEANAKLNMFYEMQDWFADSVEKGAPKEQIEEECGMLLNSEEELNEKIDAAIDFCEKSESITDYLCTHDLREQKDKINAYLRQLAEKAD